MATNIRKARNGYVIHMWTGFFRACDDNNCRECPPKLYGSKRSALSAIRRCPSWGRSAVSVYAASVTGDSYSIGDCVANGSEA